MVWVGIFPCQFTVLGLSLPLPVFKLLWSSHKGETILKHSNKLTKLKPLSDWHQNHPSTTGSPCCCLLGAQAGDPDGDISIAGRGCGYGGGGAVTSSAGSSTYILNLGLAFCRFSTCLDCGYYIHLDYYYMVAVKLPQTYHGFQSAVAALS